METSQNEALFRRFYISKEEKEDDFDGRDPSNSYLSRILLISSRSVKRTRETTSFYLLGRGRGRDTRPSAATLENDDDDDNDDDGDDARRRESVFVEVVDATMEEDDDGDGPCNYYIQF